MSLKRRTAAGRQAFEKAWDLAVVNKRSVLQSDIDHILQERFNGDPEWEYFEMAEYTQEEINKQAFKIAFAYPLRDITEKDVHKIREIFYDDRTVFWYLISKDADESVGAPGTSFDVMDEVVSVVYYKADKSFQVDCFEWVTGLNERHD